MPQEFCVVWFYSTDGWIAFADSGKQLGHGGSIGEATGDALRNIGADEADYDMVDEYGGEFYRYSNIKKEG